MSETAPTPAPNKPPIDEMSPEEMRRELEELRAANEPVVDTDPSPAAETDTEGAESTSSYFESDDPSKEADDHNRAVSYEILGKAVKLKHDINSKAGEAISRVDKLFAQAKNLAGKPREMIRKWHMNRAEKSLAKKESRLEKKQQDWKDKLATTGSGRLQERRQEKAARDIQKQQSKVDNFRTGRVERRRSDYKDTTELRESRLNKLSDRRSEREQSAAESRQEAIDRKAEALGKKELRKQLRGPENNASRREARQVINEILGEENSATLLRQLGYSIINQQYAERDLRKHRNDLSNTKNTIEQIPRRITAEQNKQKTGNLRVVALKKDLSRIQGVVTGVVSEEAARSELEVFNNEEITDIFTQENVEYIRSLIQEERQQIKDSEQRERELMTQLLDAEKAEIEQEQEMFSAQTTADRKRQNTTHQVKNILG